MRRTYYKNPGKGHWTVCIRADPGYVPKDPFVREKYEKALRLRAEHIYVTFARSHEEFDISCHPEEEAGDLFVACDERHTPYTLLIDPSGEIQSENT